VTRSTPPCSLVHGLSRAKVSGASRAAHRQCELGVFGSRTPSQAICLPSLAQTIRRALRVTVPDGIILHSHGEADTRCNEYPARGPGGLRAGHRTRSHAQLKTATKPSGACSTRFGDPPNTNTCPVCLGLHRCAACPKSPRCELGMRAALALHLNVQESSRFARKNYFLPRSAKGYQISMYELPCNGRMARDRA